MKVKRFTITFFIILVFVSCGKQENRMLLPIENIYMVEVNGWLPDFEDEGDSLYMSVRGLAEIDKEFNVKMTKRFSSKKPYYSGKIDISDVLKQEIIDMVNTYPSDTLFIDDQVRIYDDYSYVFLFEKEPDHFIRVGFGACSHGNLRKIKNQLFCDSVFYKLKHLELNQDSVMLRLLNFEDYVFEDLQCIPPPPLKTNKTKFYIPKYYRHPDRW
ncbi:hypothetical protein JGH11_05530 [Dysgonomonas sp. Marseille-P4677]|uniref:hypothetical protein n=1 Tax=Dysgonomonas sp. Marseille-P4677 TaxID=2364790 RepID=UPI0019124D90|nr:hypothetical protein [Dysgonomonas sp. Marseille-P4677]MBK5720325.1 hypothetical protein [Dysgonomonas sp. Marseille-P4677]